MKYEKEFSQYSKQDFIKMLVRVYEVKESTAKRTWYKYNRKIGVKIEPKVYVGIYSPDEKEELPKYKILEFNDMLRFKLNITRSMLLRYGFKPGQINWLKDAGYQIIEDKPY
jgi:hypothetical protein